MEQKNADELKARSRAAFDAQAETYDAGMQGDHARGLYRIVAGEVARACGGIDSPRVLDLGCGTGALAEIVLDEKASRLFRPPHVIVPFRGGSGDAAGETSVRGQVQNVGARRGERGAVDAVRGKGQKFICGAVGAIYLFDLFVRGRFDAVYALLSHQFDDQAV